MLERLNSEFPSNPEKRFEVIFSALGNSEPECLIMLCLSQNPISGADLHRKFISESLGAWVTDRKAQVSSCKSTLIPAGLVQELEDGGGFLATKEGLRYGQPVAAFLMERSATLPYSLLKVFGLTTEGSGRTRPVLNRARILECLVERPVQRREDVCLELGLKQGVVGTHLRYLSGLGMVKYSSADTELPYVRHQLLTGVEIDSVKTVGTMPRLTHRVADLIFEFKTVDRNFLAGQLKDEFPNRSIDSLKGAISHILSGLDSQGITRPEDFEGKKILSKAEITDRGRQIFEGIIRPIRQALSDDETLLSSWSQIPWREYAHDGVLKYRQDSSHANSRPLQQWTDELVLIIAEHPGIRRREIGSILGRSSNDILINLLRKGLVKKKKLGKAVKYYMSDYMRS